MDTKKLRQKVLDLAIRGRLVPQDPNDEPASILLDRIHVEKARLVGEGKIKKSELTEKPISEEEIPFDVPEGWVWCRLGAIINMLSGQDFVPSRYNDKGLGIPYIIGASNIQDSKILVNRWTETPTVIAKQNDLLIVCKGSGVGKMAICNIDQGHIARQIQALRNTYKFTDLHYIKYVIEVNLRPIISNANGIIPGLPRDILLDLVIPLPPLSEQRRIVRAVDELFEQIDIIERSEKELEEAADKTRSKLLDLAIQGRLVPQDPNEEPASALLERIRREKARLVQQGKLKKKDLEEKPISPDEIPFDLPEGWVWCRLGYIVDFSKSKSVKPNQINDNDWVLDLEDIEKETGRLLQKKRMIDIASKSDKHVFKKGNVLYSKLRPYLNKVIIADEDGYCTSEILVFDFGEIYNKYAQYYLMSRFFVDYAMKDAYGVKMPRVGSSQGNMALLPLPPLAEQRRIVSKLEELLHEIDKLKG